MPDRISASPGDRIAGRTGDHAHALRERVKEMQCLLDVSRLLTQARSDSLGTTFDAIVQRLPLAWQFPEVAQVRLEYEGQSWTSPGFASSAHIQQQQIPSGRIEVSYRPSADGTAPPFLEEEAQLLAAVAERITEAIHHTRIDSQVRFQALLLDQVGEAVLALDTDYHIRYWNQGAQRLFGWASNEACGRHVRLLLPAARSVEQWRSASESLSRGETTTYEAEMLRKDGSTFPAQVTQAPARDTQGLLTAYVAVCRDLSNRKRLEAQLRQAQKLEAIGQLTGGIAHDFNNLLTVIIGSVDLLAERVGEDPESAELSRVTLTAATRGADLTRRLLAFSRQQTLTSRAVDVASQLTELHSLLRRTLGESIEIAIHPESSLWPAQVDPSQLDNAILNLCLNARDAMPEGGKLEITIRRQRVGDETDLAGERLVAGDYVAVTVADTGAGIPEEVRGRVFDPFFTTKDFGEGSGLGLSMVYGFVRQSEGGVQLESQPGQGTRVTLLLPRATDMVESATEPGGSRIEGHGERILLVEDEELLRSHVLRQLTALGYRVLSVSDGRRALDVLEQDPDFDLLFTDVVMPGGLDGFALGRQAAALRPGLRVLFTSGHAKGKLPLEEVQQVTLLEKPYQTETLAAKVREALHVPVRR